jgi:hypothetical protein
MLWIAHRGNIDGPDTANENKIEYIDHVLYTTDYDVEIDISWIGGKLYLGHEEPQEELPTRYLNNKRLWLHCKNSQALLYMNIYGTATYFWHQDDDYTLTSNGKIWVYPGIQLLKGSIAVIPEVAYKGELKESYGICTDYINRFKQEVMDA